MRAKVFDWTGWFKLAKRDGHAGAFIAGVEPLFFVCRLCTRYPWITIRIGGLNSSLPVLE